ncbi:MAG: ParA family protein [Simkaniaceae bacterium]
MNIITVSSFKGGTAKTSTMLHIGAALSKYHGKKVLLVDFDSQANLTTGLGYDPDNQDSLAPALQGEKIIDEVILQTPFKNLDLIPADSYLERIEVTGNLASDRYSHERLKELLEALNYDFILIDTPPSLCWLTESALIAANYCLICATPEFYSIKGLERLSSFLDQISRRHPFDILGVALSFWNKRGRSNTAFLESIQQSFPGKTLQTKIRRDITVSVASIKGKPVFEVSSTGRAAEDYQNLTKELIKRM